MNLGHGHVFPRSDGVRARCGGPMLCGDCARDYVRRDHGETAPHDTAAAASDLVHSEEFVVMALGYISANLPELRKVEPPRLLRAWESFKREMGKR